jgi:heme exporter protein CcmD
MYDIYIYASYGVTAVLLGGLIIVSFRQLSKARRQVFALEAGELKKEDE